MYKDQGGDKDNGTRLIGCCCDVAGHGSHKRGKKRDSCRVWVGHKGEECMAEWDGVEQWRGFASRELRPSGQDAPGQPDPIA
jgi:hypothetical protein